MKELWIEIEKGDKKEALSSLVSQYADVIVEDKYRYFFGYQTNP